MTGIDLNGALFDVFVGAIVVLCAVALMLWAAGKIRG